MKVTITLNFNEVLKTIQRSKQKALQQVNTTLIELYWEVGKYISVKTLKEHWGKGLVKELATYIKEQDPTIKGFTDKNIWMMKKFYETYKDDAKLYTLCREISWSNNRSLSPTVISEYKTKLIPKKILQDKMNELYDRYDRKGIK